MSRRAARTAVLLSAFVTLSPATSASAEPLQVVPTATEIATEPFAAFLPDASSGPDFEWYPADNLAMCVRFRNLITPDLRYTLLLTATGGNTQVLGTTAAIVQTAYGSGTGSGVFACIPGGAFDASGGVTFTATASAVVLSPVSAPTYVEPNVCLQSPTRTACVN